MENPYFPVFLLEHCSKSTYIFAKSRYDPCSFISLSQAHKGTLRSVAAVGPRVLTSGEDGTLKVWNASNATQAGQFFMTSPVTCVAGENHRGNELVIGGDALGNVIALKYLQ